MGGSGAPIYQTNVNINFRISNELACVHVLEIKLGHPIFGFERTDIKH